MVYFGYLVFSVIALFCVSFCFILLLDLWKK